MIWCQAKDELSLLDGNQYILENRLCKYLRLSSQTGISLRLLIVIFLLTALKWAFLYMSIIQTLLKTVHRIWFWNSQWKKKKGKQNDKTKKHDMGHSRHGYVEGASLIVILSQSFLERNKLRLKTHLLRNLLLLFFLWIFCMRKHFRMSWYCAT